MLGGLHSVSELRNLSEEWRREYMTLMQRDKENQKYGKLVLKVEQIRRAINANVTEDALFAFHQPEFVEKVSALIDVHPDWDDEDVASALEDE